MSRINLIGLTFGKLKVIEELPTINYRRKFSCLCNCGNKVAVAMSHLRTGHTTSCGCLQKSEPNRLVHGHNRKGARTQLYHVWDQLIARCNNPKSTKYSAYGAKGVSVCADWLNFINFKDWAISHGYQEGLTIDRENAYGNYEPSNCHWVPHSKQGVNKRVNSRNTSGYVGVTFHVKKQKWVARITVNGVRVNLGDFSLLDAANTARLTYMHKHNLIEHTHAYLKQRENS